jgi:hypothetical protein
VDLQTHALDPGEESDGEEKGGGWSGGYYMISISIITLKTWLIKKT